MHALLEWFAFWSIGPVAAALSGGTPVVLTPGVPVERSVSGGDAHEYTIALAHGDVLHAVVDQRGIDMVEELYDPAGRLVLRIDCARGAYGPEPIWLVAERNGHYRIRVTSLFATARGSYTIRVEERRTSTPRDERRAEAARLSARARNFEALTTPRERAESQRTLVKSARIWGETGDAREEALALLDVGRAFQQRAENRGSLSFFRESEARAAAAGDQQLQAKVLSSEGFAFSWLGDPTASFEAFARSASLARAAGDPQQEAAALHGQALSRWHTGAFQEALDLDRRSLAIARSLDDAEQEAWALWGLGLTDVMLGELERSIEESSESLAIWRELRDSFGESSALQNLGYAYWLMGRGTRALDVYRQALAAARVLGDRGGEALALTNIGLAETDLAPDSAARTLEEAVALWRRVGSKHGEALALRNLGQALERLGRRPEALARSSESVVAARAGGDRPGEAYALDGLAALEARDGDLDAARAHIEASLAILESLRGGLAAAPLQSSFLSTKQDYYGTALEIFLLLDEREPGRGYAAEAFRASERGRARALADAVAVARLDSTHELPTDVARREKDLGAEIDRLQKELSGARDHAAAEKRLRGAEEEWDALLVEIRRRAPRYAALRYSDAMSYEEARSLVDPSAALVSYALQIDPPAAFVLTATGLAVHRLPVSAADLRERVENYVGLLARDDADRWGALSSELYRELISPWRDALPVGVRRLVIVPDGVLHSLPFEALARPGSRPRRLLEDFAVSYAPSATVLGELSASHAAVRTEVAADLLVVAAPAFGTLPSAGQELEGETFDLSPLPEAAAEARSIGRFGGPASEIDVGENASEARIKGRSLERFSVVHFATHTLLSRRVPSRSALLLASDGGQAGLLTAREIHRLRLRSDLVVLSACRTAQGRILAGEGVQSLAQAFFHAGARSLVASLWDVGDRRTAPLMTAFYRRLAAGSTKAEALRESKLEMLRQNPNLAPRFWAPFVLIGEPNARVPLHEPGRDWRVAGAAALVGGMTWALIRRQRRARSKGKGPSFSAPAAVSTSTVQK